MVRNDLIWRTIKPPIELNDFVESFWMLDNQADKGHPVVILPDGRFDILFLRSHPGVLRITLKGLDTQPDQAIIPANTLFFAISFKPLAIEYLLDMEVHLLLNIGIQLPTGFWGITSNDLDNFDAFCEKVSLKMISFLKPNIDIRKRELFNFIYHSGGTATVKTLSEKVFWESRQINRYFTKQFGISLKAYCNILRFKSSLSHIKKESSILN